MKLECPNCGKILERKTLREFCDMDCPNCRLKVLSSRAYNRLIRSSVYPFGAGPRFDFKEEVEDELEDLYDSFSDRETQTKDESSYTSAADKDEHPMGGDDGEGDYIGVFPVQ